MANVTTQHPEYASMAAFWSRCRDLIEGSDTVKRGSAYDPLGRSYSYLPTPPGMSAQDFEFYKARAQFFNAMARTVTALSGAVFTKPPTVECPDETKVQLEDLTSQDEPLDVVAQKIVTEVISVGRVGVFLEMPEKAPAGTPPYWAMRLAQNITNWRTARVGDDPAKLVLVVIAEEAEAPDEFGHDCVTQYRQLALVDGKYQVRVWTRKDTGTKTAEYEPGEWIVPMRRGVALDFIPFTFVGIDGVSPCVSKPPLLDLANVNVGHFRNSADHEQGLFNTAIPTYFAAGMTANSTPLKVGGSAAWMLPQGATAGVLEFSGAGMKAILDAMTAKEKQMASLGARLLEDPSANAAETATAVRMRHSGEGAALRTIAGAGSTALTTLLRWHAWWAGTGGIDQSIKVALAQEFSNIRATPEEVKALVLQVQAGLIGYETFYANLQKGGWTREGVSAAEELKAIEAEEPMRPEPPEPTPPKPGDPPMPMPPNPAVA
jgi:hypothetical protein